MLIPERALSHYFAYRTSSSNPPHPKGNKNSAASINPSHQRLAFAWSWCDRGAGLWPVSVVRVWCGSLARKCSAGLRPAVRAPSRAKTPRCARTRGPGGPPNRSAGVVRSWCGSLARKCSACVVRVWCGSLARKCSAGLRPAVRAPSRPKTPRFARNRGPGGPHYVVRV
jgi:hypothetical protein